MLQRLKGHILGLFILIGFSGQAFATLAGESPYTRLRVQFLKAEMPILSDFQLGQPWYCSSSLEAAKGQLRYVSLWEHRYLWTPSAPEAIENQHEFYPMVMNPLQAFASYSDLFSYSVTESFRVTENGHLIVEVATSGESLTAGAKRSSSLVHEGLVANNYYLCMNPEWNGNDDWEYDREQIFSVDDQL